LSGLLKLPSTGLNSQAASCARAGAANSASMIAARAVEASAILANAILANAILARAAEAAGVAQRPPRGDRRAASRMARAGWPGVAPSGRAGPWRAAVRRAMDMIGKVGRSKRARALGRGGRLGGASWRLPRATSFGSAVDASIASGQPEASSSHELYFPLQMGLTRLRWGTKSRQELRSHAASAVWILKYSSGAIAPRRMTARARFPTADARSRPINLPLYQYDQHFP
jgi:hypothetical protein